MAKDDCIYHTQNTTIVSLCNGSARDRHINRAEVRRGIEQLIKDCGLIGGFTGFHVVNNLTFGAYGVAGGVNRYPPAGSPPPDTPGGSTVRLAKRDCSPIPYDGQPREGCDRKYELNDDGTCGDLNTDNGCQAYCELTRRYLLGPETKAPGDRGQRWAATAPIELTESKEYSISTGFDIGVEGIAKEIFAAGVSFSCLFTLSPGVLDKLQRPAVLALLTTPYRLRHQDHRLLDQQKTRRGSRGTRWHLRALGLLPLPRRNLWHRLAP